MTQFKNKTIIVTGASRGIGEATARYFGQAGATVILAARSTSDIERVAGEIKTAGGHAYVKVCDVSHYEQVKALVNFAQHTTGRLDILVNNAGTIEPIARLADSDPEKWSITADTNYKSVYYAMHSAIPLMLSHTGGTIVNISSGAATSAIEGWSHYCSSKAAALSLTACAHKEYVDQGIRVVGLSPGSVATNMQVAIKHSGINAYSQVDWSQHIPPEWVAQAIAFLCGDEGREFAGTDFSLKNNVNRSRVGLPLLNSV